jgi:hypothetical protein
MSVKAASRLVTRAMRVAVKETILPSRKRSERRSLHEAGKVSRQFGQKLHKCTNAYTGMVDQFGCPDNTVDNWRFQFSGSDPDLKAANDGIRPRKKG